ncbi:hypothetical protein V9T40_003390 [Parthenolecanium corni]|uniref:Uncharacterized protein n=1 Tax=Parthenolecanium corni TaxID=536013 RepID=A0AAN9TUZ3_9HEMI
MSTGQLSTSNQDGLLAHVSASHPPSQQMRPYDDDESPLIMCSLAKSRPACRRRGASSQQAPRLSVTSASLEPAVEEEEDDHEDEDDAEEEDEDDDEEEVDEDGVLHASSPLIDVIEQIHRVPYEEITESFRKDINQMMKYDTLVNSIRTEKRTESTPLMQQRPTAPIGQRSTSTRRMVDVAAVSNSPFASSMSRVTEKDMDRLREFVRMDRGLPLTKKEKRKLIEFRKEPAVRPKMNRASAIRTQHIRKCSHSWSSKTTFDIDASIKSREEEMMKRLKKLASLYTVSADKPLYKYNKGFELRYQANKGNPLMPSSFRDSYEAYNKPLFAMPRKLSLPRRYLWPEHRKNMISYLGFNVEAEQAPAQYQEKRIAKQRKTRKLARPPVRKTQRVLRMKPTPQPKSKKTPWNYGVFERTTKKLEYH